MRKDTLKFLIVVFIILPILVATALFGVDFVLGVLFTLVNVFLILASSYGLLVAVNGIDYSRLAFSDNLAVKISEKINPSISLINLPAFDSTAIENSREPQKYSTSMEIPPEYRIWFDNPDGSCVQCSIGMVGMHMALPEWTYVLWDTEYGPAQRGGSYPSRVDRYAKARNMNVFNVTGNSYEDTRKWMVWAAKTNRFAAIGAGFRHFQTLYGYDPLSPTPWLVCNNNSTYKIDRYTEEGFRRLHMSSGPWVVVPNEPSSPKIPVVTEWWQ